MGGEVALADAEALQRHLSAGEELAWVGHPEATRLFTRADLFLVPFSILWLGFAVFWEAGVVMSGAGMFFALWGIPFVLLGLYFVAGRFFYEAFRNRRTVYAVTNRRVVTISRGRRGERVEATSLRALPTISTSVASDGRGSVLFGGSSPFGSYTNTGMELFARGNYRNTGVGFFDIADPRAVADLVERLRDEDRG